jgi:hypothetical protein
MTSYEKTKIYPVSLGAAFMHKPTEQNYQQRAD